MTEATVCGFVGPGDTCTYAKGHADNHSWEPAEAARSPQEQEALDLAHLQRFRDLRDGVAVVRGLLTTIEAQWSTKDRRPPATYYAALRWLDALPEGAVKL